MNRLTRNTNLTYGFIVLVGIVAAFVLAQNPNDPGMLATTGVVFLTFGVVVAWVIQLVINHRVIKHPPKPMTPDESARYKRTRIWVAIGLIIFLLSPFLFGR